MAKNRKWIGLHRVCPGEKRDLFERREHGPLSASKERTRSKCQLASMKVTSSSRTRWVCSVEVQHIEGKAGDRTVLAVYTRSQMISGPEPRRPSSGSRVGNMSNCPGSRRFILKSGQEPSEGHQRFDEKCSRRTTNCRINQNISSENDSKSNREVECAVQPVRGLARTLKTYVEHKSGSRSEPDSPISACSIERTSPLLALFH